MTPDRGLQPDMTAVLVAQRDSMRPDFWRLAWEIPAEEGYSWAEGECSARLFKRRYQAVAYGEKAYGATAGKPRD